MMRLPADCHGFQSITAISFGRFSIYNRKHAFLSTATRSAGRPYSRCAIWGPANPTSTRAAVGAGDGSPARQMVTARRGGPHDEDIASSVRRQLPRRWTSARLPTSSSWRCSPTHRVPGAGSSPPRSWAWCPPLPKPALPPDTRWHPVRRAAADGLRPRARWWPTPTPGWPPNCPTRTSVCPGAKRIRTRHCGHLRRGAGHQVDATNLQRSAGRRGVITRTGTTVQSGRSGGRPAALYRFTDSRLGHRRVRRLRPPSVPESTEVPRFHRAIADTPVADHRESPTWES